MRSFKNASHLHIEWTVYQGYPKSLIEAWLSPQRQHLTRKVAHLTPHIGERVKMLEIQSIHMPFQPGTLWYTQAMAGNSSKRLSWRLTREGMRNSKAQHLLLFRTLVSFQHQLKIRKTSETLPIEVLSLKTLRSRSKSRVANQWAWLRPRSPINFQQLKFVQRLRILK